LLALVRIVSPAMTVAVADWFVGYDWSITSVFLRLTVKPNRLAASAKRSNSSCMSGKVWATSAQSPTHTHTHTTVSWPFVRDNPGNQYQKKQSPTHTYDEVEEGFTLTTRSIAWEFMNPLDSALNQRGLLDPIKPAYNQKSGQMAGSH